MEVAFVQQPLPQTLSAVYDGHRKACILSLPLPTKLLSASHACKQHASRSFRIRAPAWRTTVHAKSDFVQTESQRRSLRGRATQKSASCQAPRCASCRASAGGATLVHEESPAVRPADLHKEIKRLRALRERLRVAISFDERCAVLESDPEVQRVWKSLRDSRQALRLEEAHGKYLLDCMIAAGQGHLLESLTLLVPRDHVNGKHCNGTPPPNGVHKGADTGVSLSERLSDAHSERAPYLEAFHMLADTVRKLELDSESNHAPNHPALLTPLLAPAHLAPANAHAWEQRLASGRPEKEITAVRELVDMLGRLEKFYDSIGGVVGYQLAALELIRASEEKERSVEEMESSLGGDSDVPALTESPLWDGSELLEDEGVETNYHMPVGPDLAADPGFARQAAAWGLAGLPSMGEMYPLGGAGDRLGLVDERSGECLPVAMLPYCGRTLLEGLIRDLQAREYLYFRLYGVQHTTPVAIMTSAAKDNHRRVVELCKQQGWFGRGRNSFRLFEQPLVPVVAADDGRWLMHEPLQCILKPGGHGVIWKLAHDEKVFDWFRERGRKAAIVRQISNPMAAMDATLLALSGVGLRGGKRFGFASCERRVGASEGMNVLKESRTPSGEWRYGVSNIEYTEFERMGVCDVAVAGDSLRSQYPANTNVLYVDLGAAHRVAAGEGRAALPGMIINLKKTVEFKDHTGRLQRARAGRLECTMQNIADELAQTFPERLPPTAYENLDTFVVYNSRTKVSSSAKRRRKPGEMNLHQTPDGSFFDLMANAHDLLTQCHVSLPPVGTKAEYLQKGPPFFVLLHPALGPLWDVIGQKIVGGSLARGAELQLEIAELCMRHVSVEGSLVVRAENVMGEASVRRTSGSIRERILTFGRRTARCRLENVTVRNMGIDWSCLANVYWQNRLQRDEVLEVVLHGDAEFDARDVTLEGGDKIEVPAGHRLTITRAPGGGQSRRLEPLERGVGGEPRPSWHWQHSLREDGRVELTLVEGPERPVEQTESNALAASSTN